MLQNGTLQPIAQAISIPSTNDPTSKQRARTPPVKPANQSSESESNSNHSELSKSVKRKETQIR